MANPYRWVDDLARQGWLPRLSAAELRLLLAVGVFYMRADDDARADALTLQAVTGLSESGLHKARDALVNEKKLIRAVPGTRQGKFRTYRVTVYRLVVPVPPVARSITPRLKSHTAGHTPPVRSKDSTPVEQTLHARGDILSPNPAPIAANDPLQTLERYQPVEGAVISSASSSACGSDQGDGIVKGVAAVEIAEVIRGWLADPARRVHYPNMERVPLSAAEDRALRRLPETLARLAARVTAQPEALEAAVVRLSRKFQSLGVLVVEREIAAALGVGAVAGLPRILTESNPPLITLEDVVRIMGPVEVLYDGPAPCPTCAARSGGSG